ncbi:type I polyketide synthase [Streptomyces sp. NPDC059740]|uniref:type I polyketide synthase n=1 Tax=Streptomyces sp. NPDC059740 TaxID=3346926 RepID=UPI00365BCF2B
MTEEPLAIVGMGCRYPGGVASPEDLWALLSAEEEVAGDFPTDRGWDLAALRSGGSAVDRGGFLDDAAGFDAAFFGLSPREAEAMDPQQRLALEVSWEALEHAGIDPAALRHSNTGVFLGAEARPYGPRLHEAPELAGRLFTGTAPSVISGRLAYTLGLRGPALTVDTSASSSLVALHLAATALRGGECTLALVGGVSVMTTPYYYVAFTALRGLAADGRCKAFSDDADGTAWSEGAGMLVLEPLSSAHRNRHRVLAVLRGTAVNSDGPSRSLTAPDGDAQQAVIRSALARSGLGPADVDAVEAHGTGTPLGDRIEAASLLAAYGQDRPADRPLLVGSAKSHLGHTLSAAGVAGVIKTVLALRHARLPKSLHITRPATRVDWTAGAVRLLTDAQPWPETGRQKRAGVSGFGIGGTNAHVILEEAPRDTPTGASARADDDAAAGGGDTAGLLRHDLAGRPLVWPLSARSTAALAAQADRLGRHLAARPGLRGRDVAWSLVTTRSVFEHRAVVLGAGGGEAAPALTALAAGRPAPNLVTGEVAPGGTGRTVFVFPGQGGQWVRMGCQLAEESPVFAARLAQCARALAPYADWELDDVLAGRHGFEAADVVQPALWAVMVSLAAVWQAAGVHPDAVVGHSQGEIAAATVAGVLSLEDAARVVALRSRTLTALAGRGGMLAVGEPAEAVRERIRPFGDRLAVAAVNGPAATVVSGDPAALRELADGYPESVRTRLLPVDYASHSAHVTGLREKITEALAGITPRSGRVPMVSAMSGERIDGPELGPHYWYASLRETVEFERAVRVLAGTGHQVFVEVSPHPVLTGAIGDTVSDEATVVLGTLRRADGGAGRLLTALAEAYTRGVEVDWRAVLPAGDPVDLPTYAFQHDRYWLSAGTPTAPPGGSQGPSGSTADGTERRGKAPSWGERLATLAPADRDREVLELVVAQAAATLGHADPRAVRPGRTFKEQGFESVAAVELRNRLVSGTGLPLPQTLVFDHPTPHALAHHLCEALAGPAGPSPLSAALDHLETLLATGDGERAAALVRLEALVREARGGAADGQAEEGLDDASDEDIFALIDTELGLGSDR